MLHCKKYARRISREGFTLVELLIVIVVIGVLSAMMMLSSTEAVSSARAMDIISNLHNWKTATLEYYMDHIDEVETLKGGYGESVFKRFADCIHANQIAPYLNGEFKEVAGGSYQGQGVVQDGMGLKYFTKHHSSLPNVWLIGCEFANDARVKEKLEARASSVGLVDQVGQPYKATTGNNVYIKVADFN